MLDRVLTEREMAILGCVVENYVQTATPVGSRYLAKHSPLGVSPATIRNVMNDLEEMGYLCQPHVSAGRIPSDKGYRFYVDSLMPLRKLRKLERQIIADNLQNYSADVNEILDVASQMLGKVSAQLGIVLEPKFYQGVFEKMDLVSVSENRVLAVISIQSGLVKTIMMEIKSGVSRDQLEQTSWIINERLHGLSLKEVKESIDARLSDVALSDDRVLRYVLSYSDKLFSLTGRDGLHFGGANNIVANPEFSEKSDVARVLDLIEGRESLWQKFDQGADDKLYIRIGSENEEDLFHNYSVVATRYHIGNVTGALGVVGPTRMRYAKVISLVDYVGDALTKALGDKLS